MSGRKKMAQEEIAALELSGTGVQTQTELIIVSMLFLARCDVLADDVEALSNHLGQTRDWLDAMESPLEVSGLAFRLLFWLAALHVRMSVFMIEPTPKGTLFRVLDRLPNQLALRARSNLYLAEAFGPVYPDTELAKDIELMTCRNLNFENISLINKIIEYRCWKTSPAGRNAELDAAKREVLQSDMRRLQAEYRLAIVTNPAPNQVLSDIEPMPHFSYAVDWQLNYINIHWLMNYGTFKTSQVILGRILNPDVRSDPETAAAVAEILNVALKLRSKKDHKITRSFAWPLPLFVAGIETVDDVYADWILRFMEEAEAGPGGGPPKDGGGMGGGSGGEPVRRLIQRVRARQHSMGNRVEVRDVIEELRGIETVVIF